MSHQWRCEERIGKVGMAGLMEFDESFGSFHGFVHRFCIDFSQHCTHSKKPVTLLRT